MMIKVRIKVTAPTKQALTDAIAALHDGPFLTVKASASRGDYSATLEAEYPTSNINEKSPDMDVLAKQRDSQEKEKELPERTERNPIDGPGKYRTRNKGVIVLVESSIHDRWFEHEESGNQYDTNQNGNLAVPGSENGFDILEKVSD